MGKQTAVALTPVDEAAFLGFLHETATIRILVSSGPTIDSLWVDSFETAKDNWQFYLWNTAFPWEPEFGTVTKDPTGKRNGWRYLANSFTAPIIEYGRHNFDSLHGTYGRVYWCKSFAAPNGLEYDEIAFNRWYSSVVRWLRKTGKQAERGTLNTYYLPDAWAKYGSTSAS